MSTKRLTTRRMIDLSSYVNSDTGELLSSELGNTKTMVTKEKNGMMSIHSENYAVIDSDALMVMANMLNNSDLANVIKMAIVTKTEWNVLYNHTSPHSKESLKEYLQIKSEAMYIQLIKRLMQAGILYRIEGKIHGSMRKCYLLNPFISRKRKIFSVELAEIFSEFKLL